MKRAAQVEESVHFSSLLERSNNKLWGAHVRVPEAVVGRVRSGSSRRVVCTINGRVTFQCALLAHRDGSFVISVNKKFRDRLGVSIGSELSITLKKDESEYGLPVPEELEELLRQDPDGRKYFHSLTRGKQRTLLYLIGSVKNPDRRIERSMVILKHLKGNRGTINYRQLNSELKKMRSIPSSRRTP